MTVSTGEPAHVASFYHLRDERPGHPHACAGLACFAARTDDPARWQAAQREPRLYCLGQCHRAPAAADAAGAEAPIRVRARAPVLLERILAGGATDLDAYRRLGGGRALERARALAADALIGCIEASGLRGRGGAGFPTGRKWAAVAAQAAADRVVVANADEGDAGAYSDRALIEHDPFRLIEGLSIAAHAIGAPRGYVYLRKEYPRAARVLTAAIDEAQAAGWLAGFELRLVIGQGSYVAGEETALLNSIEGRRAQARLQPPRVAERGLFGAPTLVQNVETLCAVPWIVEHGAQAYAALGFSRSRGTKLLSLNSLFCTPGVVEVEFGLPLRELVEDIGGGLRRGVLRALMVGGPLAGLLPPALLDTRLGFEEMAAVGGAVGHGGVIAFADDSAIAEIAAQVFRFGASESCARCVPCHRGTPRIAAMFEREPGGVRGDAREYAARIEALAATSLCGHGRGLAEFAMSLERHFPQELRACLA
ncbi:NADH-ubiquinone oxidoreductase-F iron-sulfur binding region domain-containing protein [Fontimonas sp. SYSU GA230001]|uniref:NADH-ubiquinone oxidoreductase-F iron-sulfur binding region domain-containing protein n=1 Tax=Fontimonas sp. SYSU GA230001 TaxID=3142450 RepID=UPI0032B616B9